MKYNLLHIITFLILSSVFNCAYSQNGIWTWMSGDSTVQTDGYKATGNGIPSVLNKPLPVYGAAQWCDNNGDFWLYGGSRNYLSTVADFVKFNPTDLTWTFINGYKQDGISTNWGVPLTPSPNNTPGIRTRNPATWVDHNNNLWMYGGHANDETFNDLWKYDVSTKMWTCMGGAGTGNQPPAQNYNPGDREFIKASWYYDSCLYFFGGVSNFYNNNYDTYYHNDIWKYDINLKKWSRIKGLSVPNTTGNLGQLHVPSAQTIPPCGLVNSFWQEKNKVWILFAYGFSNNYYGCNALFSYDVLTNNWTWEAGNVSTNQDYGNWGTNCEYDSLNEPPALNNFLANWIDSCNNLWLFGGEFSSTNPGASIYSKSNDMWMYNTTIKQWIYVSGTRSYKYNNYGIKGIPKVNNYPTNRSEAYNFKDKYGNFWLYSGADTNYSHMSFQQSNLLNDMWKYSPGKNCINIPYCGPFSTANFTCSPKIGCDSLEVNFTNTSTSSNNFIWYFGDGDSSNLPNPSHLYANPGTYTVTLISSNDNSSDTLISQNIITINKSPVSSFLVPDTTCNEISFNTNNQSLFGNQYYWLLDNQFYSNYFNTAITPINTGPTKITLIVKDSLTGCLDTSYKTIYISINGNLHSNYLLIKNDSCVPTQITLISNCSNATNFSWVINNQIYTDSILNYVIYNPGITNAILVAYQNTNCGSYYDTSLYYSNFYSNPVISEINDTTIISGTQIHLIDTVYNCNQCLININPSSFLNCSNCLNSTSNPNEDITYLIAATNNNGCQSIDTVNIKIDINETYYIPDIFSPNDDGINDILYVFGKNINSLEFNVYDRWGKKLFSSNKKEIGWDGKYNNKAMDQGSYIFNVNIKFNSGKEVNDKGSFILSK